MPEPVKIRRLLITGSGCRSEEGNRGPVGIAANRCRERGILDSFNEADVVDVLPGLAEVIRCCDDRIGTPGSAEEINAPITVDPNSWIRSLDRWCSNTCGSNSPGCSVVLRDNYGLFSTAVLI